MNAYVFALEYFSRGLITQFYEYVIRFVSIKFDVKVILCT